jgi:RNA-directed DNA polymerase
MKERLAKFGLGLNEAKTRLIEFGRFATVDRRGRGQGKPETFNFLGMTHACGKTRRDGQFLIQRKPVSKNIRRKLAAIKAELRRRMHEPMAAQGQWLRAVVQGRFNYYAVPGTTHYLNAVRTQVSKLWLRTLQRRSHKGHGFSWARLKPLLDTWIPRVRILPPYPSQRLRV